jgi:flagellar hook-associated protein 2
MSSTSATSNPVTIANGTAGAAGGSVINVSQLVSQLVQATQAPQQNLIATRTTAVTTQISAVGQLKSALSTFQSSLGALDTESAFNAQMATSSDTTLFSATITSGAPVGTYNVTIDHLASAQQLLSGQFTGDGTTSVGTGTLHLSLGDAGFDVTVTSEDDTLNGIAAAINSATGNPGITAAVLQGSDGAHLVVSSTQTGAANTIAVTETDGGNALSALTYDSTNTGNYTEQSGAKDAAFSISGVDGTSPTNTVTTALNGVTLNLLKPTPTGAGTTPPTLSVLTDTGTIENNIKAFVTAYNTLAGTFSSLGSFDATTEKAGPMLGDALLTGMKTQVQRALYSVVHTGSSTYNTLASIGITSNSDGTLSLDMTKLGTALSTNFSSVSALFSSTNGVATSLNSLITQNLGTKGAVASRSQTLVNQENDLTKQTNELNDQMTALTASLTLQYSSLNTLLSSLQTTSAYLTQALAALPSVQSSKSG